MGRPARLGFALLAAVVLVCAGCSSKVDTVGTEGPPSTISGQPPASEPTPPADTVPDGDGDLPTDLPLDTEPPLIENPDGEMVAPAVAQAGGGWRLVVNHPTAGSTVGRAALVCYVVTGPVQSAAVVLEVTVVGQAPVQVAGSVGRGSAHADLTADPEPRDVRVQLIVDGRRLDGGAVTIPAVLVAPAVVDAPCP